MNYRLPHTESEEWEKIVPPLTYRQKSIIKQKADGMTTEETCFALNISRRTYFAELETLCTIHDCRTNEQLYLKIGTIMALK